MPSFVKTLAQSALALCLLCAVAFAQPKPKAAVYIMGSPEGRDALRSAVNTFLIKSGKYQMIAVDAIDVVAQEQQRQMSGSVSDGDIAALGRDAGAQYVCVVERSEFDGVSYVATKMVSVQSKVAEFADMVELPPGGKIIDIIQWQIGAMLGMPVGPRPEFAPSVPPRQPAVAAQQPVYQASAQNANTTNGAVTSSRRPSRYSGKDLQAIIDKYERLVEACGVKKSDRCADVLYTLGTLYAEQADEEHAASSGRSGPDYSKSQNMYRQLIREYPSYPRVPDARVRLAQMEQPK